MIHRPDIEHPCQHCGCAVEAGEAECWRCARYIALAGLNDVSQRLRPDKRERALDRMRAVADTFGAAP